MDKLGDDKRLEQAYLIALGHPPDANIKRMTLEYLSQLQADGGSRKRPGRRCARRSTPAMNFITSNK